MRSDRPILIVIFGLPGTGKTTFATVLSNQLGIKHFNTDIIRSLLSKSQQYDEENKAFIYDEMLHLTRLEFEKGKSVIVDATFYKKKLRKRFKVLAQEYDVNVKWIEVCAGEEVVKKRVSKKRRYSEADYAVYQMIKSQFEPIQEKYIQLFSGQEEMPDLIEKAIKFIKQ
jgi:predicted kinase